MSLTGILENGLTDSRKFVTLLDEQKVGKCVKKRR